MNPIDAVDWLLDKSIVLGYSRVGYAVRRLWWPTGATSRQIAGRHVLITGGTSGIGKATALECAKAGAVVHILGRSMERALQAKDDLDRQAPGADIRVEECDVSSLADVRRFAEDFTARVPALTALVHDAGTMAKERTVTAESHEVTFATHVLGPFLLTHLLRPVLAADGGARVVFVSSGGMYGSKLRDDDPEYAESRYRGTTAYARTKRMQVVLAELWNERLRDDEIVVDSMHPGWVDTPGVQTFLPVFRALSRPIIRPPSQGADTIVWLACGHDTEGTGARFWHDRRARSTSWGPRPADTPPQRARLWDYCAAATGVEAWSDSRASLDSSAALQHGSPS